MKKIIPILLVFQVACHQGREIKPAENIPIPVKSDSIDTQHLKYPVKKGANVDSLVGKKLQAKDSAH